MIVVATLLTQAQIPVVPASWFLCDGTNGTPDLRGEFVKNPAIGRATLTFEAASILSHGHDSTARTAYNYSYPPTRVPMTYGTARYAGDSYSSTVGGGEPLPPNVAVNYFKGLNPVFEIGFIINSFLTLAQLNATENKWAYCDGGSVAGSAYATLTGQTTTPDLRNQFLRGLDNGRGVDGGRTMRSFQATNMGAHNHYYTAVTGAAGHTPGPSTPAYVHTTLGTQSSSDVVGATIASENIAPNVAVYYFLKIN